MRARKIQNIIKHHVHQHRNGPWILSPVIIAELVLMVVIAGAGISFAITQTPVTTTNAPWEGTSSIQGSEHFSVANYSLSYNDALNEVNGVNISLVNSNTGALNATVKMALLDNTGAVLRSNTNASRSYAAGVNNLVIPFSPGVSITNNISTWNIIVTEP